MAVQHPLTVLLAEDSDLDIHAIRRCWSEVASDAILEVVKDGRECIDYLLGRLPADGSSLGQRPDLLILDLSMPELDGFQVLARIRSDPDLKRLPVVVLANRPTPVDIHRGYELGASAIFAKPMGARSLTELLRIVSTYWKAATLPDRDSPVSAAGYTAV